MNPIRSERRDTALHVTLHRPRTRNAIDFEVMSALENLLDEVESDDTIRVLVLEGPGEEIFLSGGDLRAFHTVRSADEAKPMARRMHDILRRLEELPCWTIASVDGAVYGGGWEILLAFDFRIATKRTKFGFTQGKFCLPPGWGGLTRLVEITGRSVALRWLAGAAMVDAEEALHHRLIDRLVPAERLASATEEWIHSFSHHRRELIGTLKSGALRASGNRRELIEAELEPFARHWEDERHHNRVNRFLNRKEGE